MEKKDVNPKDFLGRKYEQRIIMVNREGVFSKALIIVTLIGKNGDIWSCFVVEYYNSYGKQEQSYTNFNRAVEHFNEV